MAKAEKAGEIHHQGGDWGLLPANGVGELFPVSRWGGEGTNGVGHDRQDRTDRTGNKVLSIVSSGYVEKRIESKEDILYI